MMSIIKQYHGNRHDAGYFFQIAYKLKSDV